MSERGERIQRLLAVLARHADVVAQAFDAPVLEGSLTDNAIKALFAEGVIKPYAEGSYRLHPRLREFLASVLASYQAFEALRGISAIQAQAQKQCEELFRLKSEGASAEDQERLYFALEDSIADIAYSIEHNLRMLHALISTQYGNVSSLKAKIKQNEYYSKQIEGFLKDIEEIKKFIDVIISQSIVYGMPQVRRLVIWHLESRYFDWSSQIKDAQSIISKNLFKMKRLERKLRLVSRYALWLRCNPTRSGWELTLNEQSLRALVRPESILLRPQPDVVAGNWQVNDALTKLVLKLPSARVFKEPQTQRSEPQYAVKIGNDVIIDAIDPVEESLNALTKWVKVHRQSMSALTWKRKHPHLKDLIDDENWLFSAIDALEAAGLQVEFKMLEEDPFTINEHFYDIVAHPAHPHTQT